MKHKARWFRALLAIACASLAMAQKPAVETAWQLLAQGKRDQAVTLLRDLIHADPRNADARLLLGSVLMENGERSESIAQLSEAVRLLPKSAEAHNALGEAYNAFGETTRGAAGIRARGRAGSAACAGTREPGGHPAATGRSARARSRTWIRPSGCSGGGRTRPSHTTCGPRSTARNATAAKAASELQQAVELRPDFAEAWSDLGDARKNLSDGKGALSAFRRAVALSPQDAVAQARLGALLLDTGAAHEAVEHLDIAVRLDPKNQSALNALQRALRQDGQAERAEAAKKKLAELLRERDESDQKLVAALEINNRGAELEKTGDVRGALEKYRAALELLPEHVGVRVNLAVALLKLGNWEEGISQMREALRREPGNAKLQKALEDALAQAKAHGIVLPKE